MGFSQENGYTPTTIETLMASVMANINTQFGTSYTTETFQATNFYKYFYALMQKVQENEVKTSEIFLKLQDYIATTNERISRPVVTSPGLIAKLEAEGYVASLKPVIEAEAGEIHVCVDVDDTDPDYDEIRLDICTILKDSTVAGCVTMGTEEESLVLSNGQAFDFKYFLPDKQEPLLRLTLTLSENNESVILTPEEVKEILIDNIAARYRLGRNFEPQRYFSLVDAPWCSQVLLEYSLDSGVNWLSTVFDAEFDDLFVILLANITVVEA